MSGRRVMSYLSQLCADMDEGRPLRRFEWRRAAAVASVPFVMGLAAGAAGCDTLGCFATPEYGAPLELPPAVSEYAAPMEPMEPPLSNAEYAAPMEPTPPPKPPEAVDPQPPQTPVSPEAVGVYGAPPSSRPPSGE